jgi:hypothetical protein
MKGLAEGLLGFASLFPEFRQPSWDAWKDIIRRLSDDVRELWVVAGRGSGKSKIVSLIAAYASTRSYPRTAGEFIYAAVIAPDRKQAAVTFRYIVGLMKSRPELEALIVAERADSIELVNGVIVEVVTASMVALRGRAYAVLIIEESAFLQPDESGANQDVELLRAVRPALARVRGSLLCVISSPYAKRGILWDAWRRYRESPDPEVVLVHGATQELNPTFDVSAIARARRDDPLAASSEYDAEFRNDISAFVSRELLEELVERGVRERLPVPGLRYRAFLDPSGGSGGDEQTLCIVHTEGQRDQARVVVDVIKAWASPFDPQVVTREGAELLRRYGLTSVEGDHYAAEWPAAAFRTHGIEFRHAKRTRSEIYAELLPVLNAGRVVLLDEPKTIGQLANLERRMGRSGRESIDHPPGGHDDRANALAGAVVSSYELTVTPAKYVAFVTVEGIERTRRVRGIDGYQPANRQEQIAHMEHCAERDTQRRARDAEAAERERQAIEDADRAFQRRGILQRSGFPDGILKR